MLKTVLIGSAVALYLVVGFYSWLTTALVFSGQSPSDSYIGRLTEFSRGSDFNAFVSSCYTFFLWPVHAVLSKLLK